MVLVGLNKDQQQSLSDFAQNKGLPSHEMLKYLAAVPEVRVLTRISNLVVY